MSRRKERPDGFVVYRQTLDVLCKLPDEKAGRVIKAAAAWFCSGQEHCELELAEEIVLSLLRGDMDAALLHHAEVCERNRRNRQSRQGQSGHCLEDVESPLATTGYQSLPVDTGGGELNRTELNRTELNRTELNRTELCVSSGSSTHTVFCPPSLDEVQAYFREQGFSSDAGKFFNYNSARGWKHVDNWRPLAAMWEAKEAHHERSDSDYGGDIQPIPGSTRL